MARVAASMWECRNPTGEQVCAIIWSLLLVAALLLVSLPTVSSQGQSPTAGGTLVRPIDGDAAMPYEDSSELSICYVDLDGSDHFNQEDSVVLTAQSSCNGNSRFNDIRLADWADRSAGERLGSGGDRGSQLKSSTPEPRFYHLDVGNTNRVAPDDTIYLRLGSTEQEIVRSGDIRITPNGEKGAGSRVLAGDSDHGRGTRLIGTASEHLRHADLLDTDTFTSHDAVYLSAVSDRTVARYGDVRIYSPEQGLESGKILGPGDPEPQSTVRNLQRYLCTVDESGTGIYNPGDPLYFSIHTHCSGDVEINDLRLSNSTHGPAGSRVQEKDADHGAGYGILPDARVAYIDKNDDGRLSRGDVAVLRITSPQEDTLQAGDLLLTPTNRGAGALLSDNDPLIGTPTRDLGPFEDRVVFTPSSGDTNIGDNDTIYLSPEASTGNGLNPEDVRLTPAGNLPFGGPAGLETGEILSRLQRSSSAVCTTTLIGDDYVAGDPVYLRMNGECPNSVSNGLVRLVPVDDHPAYSIVQTGDGDRGRELFSTVDTSRLRYLSVGESSWGYSTWLYLNIVSPNDEGIQIGDIRLTDAGEGQLAGRAVLGSDTDRTIQGFNLLGDLTDYTGYIDITDSGGFSTRDHAYIVPDFDHEYVTPLSVRLTPLPAAFTPPEVAEPAESPTTTPTPSPEPTASSTDDAMDDPDDDNAEGVDTPAPAAILFVLVTLAALAHWTRKRR